MKHGKKLLSVFLTLITVFSLALGTGISVKAADKDGLFTIRFSEWDPDIQDYKQRNDLTKSIQISKVDQETKDYLYETVATMYSENCGEAVWDIDGTTYKIKKRSYKKKVKKTKKDKIVEVYKEMYTTAVNLDSRADKLYEMFTTAPDEGTYPEYYYDPDAFDLPDTEDMNLSTQVSGVTDKLLDSAVSWFSGSLVNTFDNVAIDIATKFGPNFDYINSIFGSQSEENASTGDGVVYYNDFFNNSAKAIKTIGWSILVLLWLLCLVFSLFGVVTGYEESPFIIVARLFASAFLVLNAYGFMKIIMGIGESIFNVIANNAGTAEITSKIQVAGIIRSLLTTNGIGILLGIIFTIIILWNLFKLFLEMVERYMVMIILYIFAPLPMATFISKATEKVFYNYLSMFISQLAVFCVNLFMIKLIAAVIAIMPTYILTLEGSSVISQVIFYFFIIGLIKVAMKIDNYLADMGLTVAKTGANLAGSAMGVIAMVTSGASVMTRLGRAGVIGSAGGSKGGAASESAIGASKTLKDNMSKDSSYKDRMTAASQIAKDGVLKSKNVSGSIDDIKKMGGEFKKPISVQGEALGNTLTNHSNIQEKLGLKSDQLKSMGLVADKDGRALKADGLPDSFLNSNGQGELYMKNPDGTSSHVKLSDHSQDGFTDIGNGLFAKVDSDYAPIGGMRAIDDQGNPLNQLDLETYNNNTGGNFSKEHMEQLGFDLGENYNKSQVSYLDGTSVALHSAGSEPGELGERIGRIDTNAPITDGLNHELPNQYTYNGTTFTAFHTPTNAEMMSYITSPEIPQELAGVGFENADQMAQLKGSYEKHWKSSGYCSADLGTGSYAILDASRYKMDKDDIVVNLGDNKQAFVRELKYGKEPGGRC